MNVLLLDNLDASTTEIKQILVDLEATVEVHRSDRIEVDEVRELAPDKILISHGPDTPADAGISLPLIRELAIEIPMLGIGLGHQSIAVAFGGRAVSTQQGQNVVAVDHAGQGMLRGLPMGFMATHDPSLVVERKSLPGSLEITAWSEDGLIMGLRHRSLPVEGIQFLLDASQAYARDLLRNFIEA